MSWPRKKKPHLVKEGGLWIVYRSQRDWRLKKPVWLFASDFSRAATHAKDFWQLPRWLNRCI